MATPPKKNGQPDTIHGVRYTYADKVAHLGLLPIFISPVFKEAMVEYLYQQASGILFMGGSDIHPKHYGEEVGPHTQPHEPQRDLLELHIVRKALADKKPFLGICRGHQMLAIGGGGTLYQHLPDIVPEEEHGLGEGAEYEDLLHSYRHTILIEEGSRLHQIVGTKQIETNSAHHQGIKTLGPDMVVSASSQKGVIEAIEHIDSDYFCMGLQCHPEVLHEEPLNNVFTHFANAVESYTLPGGV